MVACNAIRFETEVAKSLSTYKTLNQMSNVSCTIQSNLSNTDNEGTEQSVHIIEMSVL